MKIDFEKMQGLIPAVVQDAAQSRGADGRLHEPGAYDKTLQTGYVTFYSRTRNKLWTKGETSGNRLRVIDAGNRLRPRHQCSCGWWSKATEWFATPEPAPASPRTFPWRRVRDEATSRYS